MQFTIKFESRKQHDQYCVEMAKKLGFGKEENIINASDFLKTKKNKVYVSNKLENKNKLWTAEEDTFIIDSHSSMNAASIAKVLKRPKSAVSTRVNVLRKIGYSLEYIPGPYQYNKNIQKIVQN